MRNLFLRSLGAIFAVLFVTACTTVPLGTDSKQAGAEPIVIMIGIDGLRWDAIDRFPAPTLHALSNEGVRAESMTPVMPSLTFVNFYALATGLHADGTGITGNMPYSQEHDAVMGRGMHSEARWWGGEPIWVTAEKQNVRTAAMFWLGSEAEIKGKRPTHWSPYEHNKPHKERVDQLLTWLAMPEAERPRLLTLYFSDVDSALHRYGPESQEEGNSILKVDSSIADLRAGIEELGLTDRVNLVVVSDHGMTKIDPEFMVYLDDYIDLDKVFVPVFNSQDGPRANPFTHLFVKDSKDIDALYNKLKGAHSGIKVYKRADIPEKWHLNNSDRTGDIFVVIDEGGMIFARALTSVYKYPPTGMHGYDRFAQDMQATFIAAGPNFKKGIKAGVIENVEVYGIVARALGIKPAKTDGDIKNVEYFMLP